MTCDQASSGDDDALFAWQFRGMTDWERAGFHIVAEARNGQRRSRKSAARSPTYILTDFSMPVMDGIGLIEYVRGYHPEIPVVARRAPTTTSTLSGRVSKRARQDYLL
jgi:two-component system response regulator YesN